MELVRILYFDIDCLRPDHLGCYGYNRPTSPVIDQIAGKAIKLANVYVSDAPCLPSRTALFSGRFGTHTGVINHGGAAAEMFIEGPGRGFSSLLGRTSWMRCLRNVGYWAATISPFGERHSAWHFYANFNEVLNTGRRGLERANEIANPTIDWLRRNGPRDNWFLHVNFWDPHTPYRSPNQFVDRFSGEALPRWYTEEVRANHWQGCGPHSAQEVFGFDDRPPPEYIADYPLQPTSMTSMDEARRMFDGYDAGVFYADQQIGRVLEVLHDLGIGEDTAIIVSADHGENLGELNIYGDHHTADQHTCRVPLILHWPGVTNELADQTWSALHYQIDVAATLIELAGGKVPTNWDGQSFASALHAQQDVGRPELVLTQGAWTCQRSVRFRDHVGDWLAMRTYHDGYHGFDDWMLFDVTTDPHQQENVAHTQPTVMDQAKTKLKAWHEAVKATATHDIDPMQTVLDEGGPKHTRGQLPAYLERLRATGRSEWATLLASRHES